MYELIILGFLSRQPMHGYLIARIINDMIGPFARISNGRLYPLLARLEADGLIARADAAAGATRADRHQRVYTSTPEGRHRFHQLMMDTTSYPGEYRTIFWHKVPFLETLAPTERLRVLDHYRSYCQTHIAHLTEEMRDLEQQVARQHYLTPAQLEATLAAMEHYLRTWRVALDDADAWRVRELARMEAPATAAASAAAPERIGHAPA